MFHDTAGQDQMTEKIIGCAIRAHEAFGTGLFEAIYKPCLVIELKASALEFDTMRRIPLTYRGHNIDAHFCPDIVVENSVIIELKAVEALTHIHKAQLMTYLKLTGLPVGLLINFNVERLGAGWRKILGPDLYVKGSNA